MNRDSWNPVRGCVLAVKLGLTYDRENNTTWKSGINANPGPQEIYPLPRGDAELL